MKIEVRFSDIDSQGHVNHIPITEWIAHARVKFFDEIIAASGESDIDHVLVHLTQEYKREIRYPADVDIHIEVFSVGNKSVALSYTLTVNNVELVTARSISVFTRILPQEIRDALYDYSLGR